MIQVNHMSEGVADPMSKTGAATHTQCPLWVISGHLHCKSACPLYPRMDVPGRRYRASSPLFSRLRTCCTLSSIDLIRHVILAVIF
jgi:hypothetical protein